jgi:DNA-binding beta-propeller fold protein YncE
LCSEIPSGEIATALGGAHSGVPGFAAEGTPSEVSQCSYAGGDLVLYLGYVPTNAPPHEGGTSTSLPAFGSSGSLQTYGSPSKVAYLTFMAGSITRPLYGTVMTQGNPSYRVGLAKLRALGSDFYALVSNGFTGTDLARYQPPAPSYRVVVINSREPQLAVLDPVDGRLRVITLQLGPNSGPPNDLVHQLTYSPSSPYVYATASTGRGMGELLEVNLSAGKLFGAPIPLGMNTNPQGVVVGPGAQFAYVVEEYTGSLAVVNLSDRQVTTIHLGPSSAHPQGLAISPNGQQVYVADNALSQISVLQTSNDSVSRVKLVKGTTPFALVVSPDGSRLWVADGNGGTSGEISEIDLSSGRIRSLLVGPLTPVGIGITPNGSEVFVTHQWNSVTVINTKTGSDTERGTSSVPVVGGAAASPNGQYMFLAGAGIQFGTGLVVYDVADNASWTLPLNQYPSFVYVVPTAASQGLTV